MLELNLMPAFNLARAAMPRMMDRGGGAFVGVSARPALRPFPGAAGYITREGGGARVHPARSTPSTSRTGSAATRSCRA